MKYDIIVAVTTRPRYRGPQSKEMSGKFVREFLRQITDSYSGKMFRESPGADTQQSEISQPGEIEERRVQIYGKIGPDIP